MLTLHCHFWPEPVAILAVRGEAGAPVVTVEAVGRRTRIHYTTSLPAADWQALQPEAHATTFDAPAQPFRLALEAERLRRAYTADPLLAANNARVDLLPHQMEAVYGVMLPQARIRHLLAHDAGAGKTIMGGLLFKELAGRQPDLRALIVAPAALTRQWQRELRDKFLVEFEIADRDSLRGDIQFWSTTPRLITSTPFARQSDVRATLANVPWDLVIVDEAHHMAGYEDRQTQAYNLGRLLSRNSRHLVLATATPHKGDRTNFLKLLQLLDGDIHDPAIANQRAPGQRGNPIMLRRLKEEMTDFDGQPLFKERVVETRAHAIGDNPPEMALYTELTRYTNKVYKAAERIGGATRVNTQFAMVILQRRMASSLAALEQSLIRRRDNLLLAGVTETAGELRWADAEEADEQQRWRAENQAELASPARTRAEREKEIGELDKLLTLLDAVRRTGRETKVEKLQEVMVEAGIAPGNGEWLLVFTEALDTLLFLRRLFEGWGYSVTQIDGRMDMPARLRAEDDFRHRCQIMVATEAAGEGINLQFCARMINYDLPWVPTRLEQRMGRIHRYGQTRVAHIYNLAAADTREGPVLIRLLDRLAEMRTDLGDGVYDVVSTLVGDAGLERLLAEVATAAPTDDAQDRALRALLQAMERGRQRQQQPPEPPCPIDRERFRQMQAASRQSRLTPEYAQHFFVDALEALREAPAVAAAGEEPAREPGDAALLALTLRRKNVAGDLGLPAGRPLLFTFRQETAAARADATYLALGTPTFDRLLDAARRRWGMDLRRGAKFIDPDLPPGHAYLLWFLSAAARDGLDGVVAERLFAVRQSAEALESFPPAALADLMPTDNPYVLPEPLPALAGEPQPAIDWSLAAQQLPFLEETRRRRGFITDLRREALLGDARQAERAAAAAHDAAVFADEGDAAGTEGTLAHARARVTALSDQFAREAACSLGPTAVLAVAAVFAPDDPPPAEHVDERPDVAAAAMAFVRAYETAAGRALSDQTGGYHSGFPYDLHSTGPGGPRRIEVKGTTTGRVILSETERHAARRFREQYFLYIVRDPLGERPALAIVRDPWARMTHDETLYSGARYVYNARTWAAAADQEIPL